MPKVQKLQLEKAREINLVNINKQQKPLMKTQIELNDHDLKAKAAALAKFLDVPENEVNSQICDHYGMTHFNTEEGEYAIATDEEADTAAKEAVLNSLWAFNALFILSECDLPSELEEGLKVAQEKQCEGANEWIHKLIKKCCGEQDFVDAAIQADGRGHFLSGYDNEENEVRGYYIYRTN